MVRFSHVKAHFSCCSLHTNTAGFDTKETMTITNAQTHPHDAPAQKKRKLEDSECAVGGTTKTTTATTGTTATTETIADNTEAMAITTAPQNEPNTATTHKQQQREEQMLVRDILSMMTPRWFELFCKLTGVTTTAATGTTAEAASTVTQTVTQNAERIARVLSQAINRYQDGCRTFW